MASGKYLNQFNVWASLFQLLCLDA